jgi:hypothetical protein
MGQSESDPRRNPDRNPDRNLPKPVLNRKDQLVRKKDISLRAAEASYEVLLREVRRDRVRCLSEHMSPNSLNGVEILPTSEEIAWLQLDRLVSPYVFPVNVEYGLDFLTSPDADDYTGWTNPFTAEQLVEILATNNLKDQDEIEREREREIE